MRLLFLLSLICQLCIAQKNKQPIPYKFQLIIQDQGLAKSSSSKHTEYLIEDYKLNYTYNYTSSMGRSDANEFAKKKFAHREQRFLQRFLEENKAFFSNGNILLEGDPSEHVLETKLLLIENGQTTTWSIKGGRDLVEKTTAYAKIQKLEALIRELGRLKNN